MSRSERGEGFEGGEIERERVAEEGGGEQESPMPCMVSKGLGVWYCQCRVG